MSIEERFGDRPGFVLLTWCSLCAHRRTGTTCKAFPERIPDAILNGDDDHKKPFPGDNGITFKQKEA